MPSAPSIRIEHRPSRWQRALTLTLVVAAGVALAFARWPMAGRILALLIYAACVALVVRRVRQASWSAVSWSADGSWRIACDDGKERPATLQESRLFGPLIALRLRVGDAVLRVLLWPDSADADDLRRLRIRLGRESGQGGDTAK
ncbi:protein YgfX [Pseudofulvimonas gallinarii]|jgi:hypothetical protein